ncbi:MAG: ImmA/IrrE family metallo-endopeptidase [Treponema sp.]|jgi:Zn-dependent peptidase ImmA (M78 family)|nr:ImmA/IrrE family metallo-endopeptidase [Treponema sp.]
MTKFEDLPEIRAAQKIKNAYNHTKNSLPVDIKLIMKDRKIIVKETKLPDDISGVLDTRGERPIVLVQKEHDKKRRRFSLAHELGHYILNSSPRGVHLDRHTYFRSNLSSAGTDMEEKKANRFAAELLMPSDILLEILPDHIPDLIDANEADSSKALKELAKLFDVSVAALTIKISGVLKGMGF